jgi:flagellar hook-associated protein 2
MTITLAASSTSNTGTLSAAGVGSGLDVNSIVTQLMTVENQPLTALDQKTASFQTKISAYGSLSAALSQFQSSLSALKQPATFGALTAQSSDTSTVSTSIGTGAVAGTYSVQVTQLAQAAKLASAGFAATTDTAGTGTLTFQTGTFAAGVFTPAGTSGAKTVTIAAGNQTVAGIRDAVNAAGIGITATIVNDGSASGNHLVFTSTASGAANSLKVTVADADGSNANTTGLSALAFDPAAVVGSGRNMTQQVAAQDAKLVIDGIPISKPSNVTTDAIEGVTINAVALTTGTGTTLTVAADASGATKAVQAFVSAYNALNTTLRGLTKYDPTTKTASTLTGDSTVRTIQSRFSAILGSSVPGLAVGSTMNTLSQAGITMKTDGSLALDSTKLTAAVNGSSGIAQLFAAFGQATDSQIAVANTGTATLPGTYAVNVTSLATRGNNVGSAAAGLTITAGVNDQLDVTVDGLTATVTLGAGTYASASALAAEVQSRINGSSTIASGGSSVIVAANTGVLTTTSARFGSASNVSFGGSAATTLFGATPASTAGLDVVGTIDGVAASGSGQTLHGATGTATDGLALTIAGGALGARGSVTFSQGYAYSMDTALNGFLATDGLVASSTDGLNRSIADIATQRASLAARLVTVEANYRAQFTALDSMIASMNTTSTYLTQQLAALPKIGN